MPMSTARKSVRDFLLGKIRRAELGQILALTEPGPPHPSLGKHQGDLLLAEPPALRAGSYQGDEPAGVARTEPLAALARSRWYELGVVLDGRAVDYEAIERIEERPFRVILKDGDVVSPVLDAATDEVAFATLRWVGRGLLRRVLD